MNFLNIDLKDNEKSMLWENIFDNSEHLTTSLDESKKDVEIIYNKEFELYVICDIEVKSRVTQKEIRYPIDSAQEELLDYSYSIDNVVVATPLDNYELDVTEEKIIKNLIYKQIT